MKQLKLVIDANILVSAYSTGGRIHEQWREGFGPHQLVISPEIFAEVERTLRQAEFHLSPEMIRVCLKDILKRCELVRPKTKYGGSMPDEKDRHLVSLGLEVHADRIITGETCLCKETEVAGIPVAKFYDFVQENPNGKRRLKG